MDAQDSKRDPFAMTPEDLEKHAAGRSGRRALTGLLTFAPTVGRVGATCPAMPGTGRSILATTSAPFMRQVSRILIAAGKLHDQVKVIRSMAEENPTGSSGTMCKYTSTAG